MNFLTIVLKTGSRLVCKTIDPKVVEKAQRRCSDCF